jgi:3-methyladenine DNA glycosylase AlkD
MDSTKNNMATVKQSTKDLTADKFIKDLKKTIAMRDIFALAKEYMQMPLVEIEKLLDSEIHEARTGAVSIMDWKARHKQTTEEERKALYNLYIKRHDRINSWGMVDRAAPYVVGGYLFDKPRKILYKLAKSKDTWERRTSIVSTYYFIRQDDLKDTFKIAEILVHDKEDLVQKAAGGWIREAGKRNKDLLLKFLDRYAATMPRTMLRYAIEHLSKQEKEKYLNLKPESLKRRK